MEEQVEQVEQGNIMRIDINMDDIQTMAALVAGLISMIKVKSGGLLPQELIIALGATAPITATPAPITTIQVPSPIIATPKRATITNRKTSPSSIPLETRHELLDIFIDKYCTYNEDERIKFTDLRVGFNEYNRMNETNVSFSKLMDSYVGAGEITKVVRQDGKWFKGIGWKPQEPVMIPTILHE